MSVQQLADDHWAYLVSVLKVHAVSVHDIAICEHHYKTAFVHGYKHGQEDIKEDTDS